MKKIVQLVITLFLFAQLANAQTTAIAANDTVYLTSSEIRKLIDDKYYVRVPNTDLEQRLQDKVSNVVAERFNTLYTIIGIASLLIGSILLFNMRSYVTTQIEKQVNEKLAVVQADLDKVITELNHKINDQVAEMKSSIRDNFSDVEQQLDLRIENYFLKNFKPTMEASLSELKEEQRKAYESQKEFNEKSKVMLNVFNETRYEKLKTNVETRTDLQTTWQELNELLLEADANKNVDMISRVINQLSYAGFYLKKDAEFEQILDTYMNRVDVNIKETAFVNAALGVVYDYQSTGETELREKAMRYLNGALRKIPDYGEALGLKLELFMTDYDTAIEKDRKEYVLQEAQKLISFINSKEIAAYETIKRLKRVQASAVKSRFIDLAYELFPEEMEKMESIYTEYINKRPTQ